MISFTPVRQSDEILRMHLKCLDAQPFDESWFYDDNDNPSKLLEGRMVFPKVELPDRDGYHRGDTRHEWSPGAVARVASIKNGALGAFYKTSHDHIFLIDSDVLIPPGLIDHLLELDVPIVSAVYWSDWGDGMQPNVWDYHPYHSTNFERFTTPGDHIVGGLGACTLIHRSVLEVGVNFNPVRGLQFAGEDRHFCVRASAADIPLIACTHYEVFHVYHDHQISEAKQWLKQSFNPSHVT